MQNYLIKCNDLYQLYTNLESHLILIDNLKNNLALIQSNSFFEKFASEDLKQQCNNNDALLKITDNQTKISAFNKENEYNIKIRK